jgi:DNA (cytosine-5)-methyltransferase 1
LLPTPVADHSRGLPSEGTDYQSLPNAVVALLPTPTRRDFKDTEIRREPHRPDDVDTLARALTDVLLPTPRATDGTKGGPNQRGSSGDLMLPSAVNLLPTPTAGDSKQSGSSGYDSGHDGTTLTDAAVRQPDRWGEYGPAIRRWEAITRPAPEPTKLNAKGNPKLSDEFDEWLMGLPAGWITDVPGVTWNEALKACGNGVVPQQASAAIRFLWVMAEWQVAA